MGQAIADASMIMADGLQKRTDAQKLSQEQQENARLKKQLQQATLRPKVGGIYAALLQNSPASRIHARNPQG
ncbi:hypothetical protein HOY34_20470 [Xinfangfangia sp. D13-10-4-6]|uniref:hypothetical protein n=1 Tax=Pseudogemmobacter hezensis TaxID=2737662 RepID=UPI0015576608|nr:hypothetical protein [Pseudogemmobacter hezensis]NPD17563.1 hypothetical protein [Pseudogemmobacter hezensis]